MARHNTTDMYKRSRLWMPGMLLMASVHAGVAARQPAPSTTTRPEARLVAAEEFPQDDGLIWVLQKRGQTPRYIAARLAARRPGLDLVRLAWQADRDDLGVKMLLAYIRTRPDDDEHTLELIWSTLGQFKRPTSRGQYERILGGVGVIRNRLPRQPRERAARVAWQLLRVEDAVAGHPQQPMITGVKRDAFIKRWAGTEAAQRADIQRQLSPPVTAQALDAVERFARVHPRTNVGAEAWAQLAIFLGSGELPMAGSDTHDPTERFLRLHATVKALQDEQDPSNEWVQRAPGLASRFLAPGRPVFGPGSVDRLLAAYRDFLIRQLAAAPDDVEANGVAFGARFGTPSLLSSAGGDPGTPPAIMDRVFDEVEDALSNKTVVRYVRARYYLQWIGSAEHPNPAMREQARTALLAVANEPPGRYPRIALALLAAQVFSEGDYAAARGHFRTYVERYPGGDWAWVAALRIGECSERLQEWAHAADEYHDAARRFARNPLARVLGLTAAARIAEAHDAREQALTDYRTARKTWDFDYGPSYSIGSPSSNVDPWKVTPRLLDRRIAVLSKR
jgi:hypothetical protein